MKIYMAYAKSPTRVWLLFGVVERGIWFWSTYCRFMWQLQLQRWCELDVHNLPSEFVWRKGYPSIQHPVVLASLSLSATTTISMAIWVTSSQEPTMGWLTMGWLWGWLKIVQHHWVKIKWNKSDPRKETSYSVGSRNGKSGVDPEKIKECQE